VFYCTVHLILSSKLLKPHVTVLCTSVICGVRPTNVHI
jgi:hypothetical protein